MNPTNEKKFKITTIFNVLEFGYRNFMSNWNLALKYHHRTGIWLITWWYSNNEGEKSEN